MKNLKKVLSLALVFAMVLGLCIGAMAADTQDVTTLTDWASVTHKDAAKLLNAFNIMQGYPSGTFQPERLVTRAEAVKMIDVALWGGVDQADLFTGSGSSSFPDVKPTDWFAGHVTYAEAYGILDGNPDGTLRPNANVTGYQMLKMALIALNYNSEVEGLTGAGWDIRTMRLATDPLARYTPSTSTTDFVPNPYDLTAGLEDITDWNAPLTRDQAAQIIYNMIQHSTVTYDLVTNGQTGNVKGYTQKSFGQLVLNMDVKHGTLYANEKGTTDPEGTTIADPTKGNALVQVGTTTTPVTLDSGLLDLGTNVTLYSKGSVLLGVTLDGWTEVAPVKNAAGVVTNILPATSKGPADYEGPYLKEVTIGEETGAKYTATTTIDTNGDGIIDLQTTIHYAKTDDVAAVVESEKFGTIYQISTTTWRDAYEKRNALIQGFITADDIGAVKGDHIAYVGTTNAYGDDVNVGVVLTPVAGEISRVTTANSVSTYYIDGTGYGAFKGVTVKQGDKGTFYTFPGTSTIVEYVAAKNAKVEDSYALLYDAGYTSTGASTAIGGGAGTATMNVAAILPDGTKTTFIVSADATKPDVDPTPIDSATAVVNILKSEGTLAGLNNHNIAGVNKDKTEGALVDKGAEKNYLVTYRLDDDGNMVITGVKTTTTTINGTANNGKTIKSSDTSVALSDNSSALIVSDTVTFIQTSVNDTEKKTTEDWTAYVGGVGYTVATSGKIDAHLAKYNETTTNYLAYAVAEYDDIYHAAGTTSAFYYVISNNAQVGWTKDQTPKPVYEVTVFDASANDVVTLELSVDAGTIEAGDFFTTITNGKISGEFPGTTAKTGYVISFSNNVLVLSTVKKEVNEEDGTYKTDNTAYVTTNDTVYYIIDGESSAKATASQIGVQSPGEPFEVTQDTVKTTYIPYGAIVIPTEAGGNTAQTVIVFTEDVAVPAE